MPVLRVARCRRRHIIHDLLQRLRSIRCPQSHRLLVKVDIVRKVVPRSGLQFRRPLRLAVCHPLQGVAGVFEFGKVALSSRISTSHTLTKKNRKYLEECNLMLDIPLRRVLLPCL